MCTRECDVQAVLCDWSVRFKSASCVQSRECAWECAYVSMSVAWWWEGACAGGPWCQEAWPGTDGIWTGSSSQRTHSISHEQLAWVWIPALLLTSWVGLGNHFALSLAFFNPQMQKLLEHLPQQAVGGKCVHMWKALRSLCLSRSRLDLSVRNNYQTFAPYDKGTKKKSTVIFKQGMIWWDLVSQKFCPRNEWNHNK